LTGAVVNIFNTAGSAALGVFNSGNATSGANLSSPNLGVSGAYWDGSAGRTDTYAWQNVIPATGTNPPTTMTLIHTGSTGGSTGPDSMDLSTVNNVKVSQLLGTVDTLSGATPAINAIHRDFTITLSANATATVSGLSAGEDINAQICQPASGGPYTFAWPAAFHGGMTIGTTASDCSMQSFHSFNGTTAVAMSTGAINVAP